jgi:hypothetical protein
MFDPDYDPYGPLSAKDAILAMVEGGETLYDEDGDAYRFNEEETRLEYVGSEDGVVRVLKLFSWAPLRRRPRRNRDWTQWELLAWASSDESRGWVVRTVGSEAWFTPQFFGYGTVGVAYQRARLLPDHSGIDEDTIQGFEVENG